MKFISGIKKITSNPEVTIQIPIYHRASISFFSNSSVYYISRSYKASSTNSAKFSELILTPIRPDIWHHIRRVTLTAIDSPGIINTITSKLRDLKINVIIEEALTTQINAVHNITLIIDLHTYISHIKKYQAKEKVPHEYIEEIKSMLVGLKNPQTNQPIAVNGKVAIEELTFLESLSDVSENRTTSNISPEQFDHCSVQIIQNKDGSILLNSELLNRLNITESSFFYTMFSDTEEKYLKILFFDSKQKVAFIDVWHQDVYGAISRFTEIIYKNKNFNILASYNSHQQIKNGVPFAHWFALIDITANSDEFFIETLESLKNCIYGEHNDMRTVSGIFLIEANISNIPSESVLKFGQNKRTKDGDRTSVFLKKRELLLEKLKEYKFKEYLKTPKLFAAKYHLHETESLRRLASQLIKENQPNNNKIVKIVASWTAPVLIIYFVTLFSPYVKDLVSELFRHIQSLSVLAFTVVAGRIIHKVMDSKEG